MSEIFANSNSSHDDDSKNISFTILPQLFQNYSNISTQTFSAPNFRSKTYYSINSISNPSISYSNSLSFSNSHIFSKKIQFPDSHVTNINSQLDSKLITQPFDSTRNDNDNGILYFQNNSLQKQFTLYNDTVNINIQSTNDSVIENFSNQFFNSQPSIRYINPNSAFYN